MLKVSSLNELYSSLPPLPCEMATVGGPFRHLKAEEIAALKNNFNLCSDWGRVLVSEDFNPECIWRNTFFGSVILGVFQNSFLTFHDTKALCGVYNCHLTNCIIECDCAISDSSIENYRIGARSIISNVSEIIATNHAKFGEGVLFAGESESTRIEIEVGNENGHRAIIPSAVLTTADCYLWSKLRGNKSFMSKARRWTIGSEPLKSPVMGEIGHDCVIKNTLLIKDTKIGDAAYIKGALKIKNVTIESSEEEPTQIGEGVILVNGVVHSGCHIFYNAIAVRFLMMREAQLKYGARLLNSVLGENSTVSCCEILNNIVFPFHEQHHNSSFLIAATIMGQSNIAAGSTVGSNHNSRTSDGELTAGRGFWPGLSTSFKHNSRFSSFTLVEKGSYNHEINLIYPFSLVSPSVTIDGPLRVAPAWSILYNMYSLVRNGQKFLKRDKRVGEKQFIETNPLAPDTVFEMIKAVERLDYLLADAATKTPGTSSDKIFDPQVQRRYGALISHPRDAISAYIKMIELFCVRELLDSFDSSALDNERGCDGEINLWVNLGGQLIPQSRFKDFIRLVDEGAIDSWDSAHNYYKECEKNYKADKITFAKAALKWLDGRGGCTWSEHKDNVCATVEEILDLTYSCRARDRGSWRRVTFDSDEEWEAVYGSDPSDDVIDVLKAQVTSFIKKIKA